MIHDHFIAAGRIWGLFFRKQISSSQRESMLAPLRKRLASYKGGTN